ncbi:hypothetical protein Tco_0206061 [Tanacetum coccineum]
MNLQYTNVGNGEPKSATNDHKQVEDGPHNESDEKISLKMIAVLRKLMMLDNMLIMPVLKLILLVHTLETTHVEFFNDEDEPEVDLGNITNSYTIEPISIAKALYDSSWVESMQEKLLQFKLQQSAFLYETIEEEVYVTQPPGMLKILTHPTKIQCVIGTLMVTQKKWNIYQSDHIAEILKKSTYTDVKSASTLVDFKNLS